MKRKWLAVGIILLFVGVAIVPSINASNSEISLDDELVVVVQTNKKNYQVGKPVEVSIYVENHGGTNITLVFPSFQLADFQVNNCYLWSHEKVFIPMTTQWTIPSGKRVFLLNDSWEQVDFSGTQVLPGTYTIIGWMVESYNSSMISAAPVSLRIGSEMTIEAHGGFGVTITLTNVGLFNATDVKGNVSIKGGLFNFINLSESFDTDNFIVNESISKKVYPFGFGPINIEIIASASNAEELTLEGRLSIILFLVYPITPPYKIIEVKQ